jgi:hypothetical protein
LRTSCVGSLVRESTLAGSLLAFVLAHGLVETFQGKGPALDPVTARPAFLLAVIGPSMSHPFGEQKHDRDDGGNQSD